MNKKINYKSFASLIFFLSESMFLGTGFNQIFNTSKNNSIISCVIGIIFGLIFFYMYYKISVYESDLDITKKIEKLYGKILGNIINIIIVIATILFFIYNLWNTEVYIQNKYLDLTPNYIIVILFLIPIIYSINKDFKIISKLSMIIYIITLIEIILSIFGLVSYLEIDNYKPLFNASLIDTLKGSFYFISFFFTPLFLLLIVPKNSLDKPKFINRNMIEFFIFSCTNLLLLICLMIGVFGVELLSTLNYPEFVLIKKINYFNFIEHIENILASQWLYSLFISATICMLYIKKYFENKNIKITFLYIIIIISAIISLYLFKSSTNGYNFIKDYYHICFSVPFLSLLIISNILIKIKKNMH